jgi:branched-chain amino acid transport system substrate-binding protein
MKSLNRLLKIVLAVGLLGGLIFSPLSMAAPEGTQFIPILGYRIGPYAANGSAYSAGMIDYLQMINERDGGVNGIKLSWQECEFEYKTPRGVECYERLKNEGDKGATAFNPLSTGVTYALIERATKAKIPIISLGYGRAGATDGRVFPYVFPIITNYWSQSTAKIKFMGFRSGGMSKLKGQTIVNLHHGSGYGRETKPVLEAQAKKYGFKVVHLEVAHPGVEQKSQWLQIRRLKPDWVILRGWGVMSPTALKEAARVQFPADRIIGVWWSGGDDDVIPAGKAAVGYISASFHPAGTDYPVLQDIIKYVYDRGKGDFKGGDKKRLGYVMWARGIITSMVMVEAIQVAHKKFGAKVISGEEMQWALEHLNVDAKRLEDIGATGFMAPLKVSCLDHEGGGAVKFQQWDGKQWNLVSDWISSDQSIVRPMVEADAAKYAKEKGITPRNCTE